MKAVNPQRLALIAVMGFVSSAFADDPPVPLKDIVVTATREVRRVDTIPANVTVITSDDIRRSPASTLPGILKHFAGIEVSDLTGNGQDVRLDIRGFGDVAQFNVLVLVDGRRVNAADLSGVDWTVIPLNRIERVEIVRGGRSVVYGDNAVGGVINIITRKGDTAEPVLSSQTVVKSYQGFGQSLSLSGKADALSYSLDSSYRSTDGYRDNNHYRFRSTGLTLSYDNNEPLRWDLAVGWKRDNAGLPGALLPTADRKSSSTPTDLSESKDWYVILNPQLNLGDNGEVSMAITYREKKNRSVFGGFVSHADLRDFGVSPRYTRTIKQGNLTHDVSVGLDLFKAETIEFFIGNASRQEVSVYILDAIQMSESVYLDLGYRRARVSYNYDTFTDANHNLDAFTFGVTRNYAKGSKVFIAVDQAYRAQLLEELGGPSFSQPVPPQKTLHYQLGVQHRINDTVRAAATVFQIDTRDEIFFDPTNFTNGNYGRTRRRGVELELDYTPSGTSRYFANVTLLDPKLIGGKFSGKDIPGVARVSASAGTSFEPMEHVRVDLTGRFSDDKRMINDWSNAVSWDDRFVVVDAKASYTIGALELFVGVNNVFDEEYSEYGVLDFLGTGKIYPSPERNYVFGITFDKAF